MGTYDDPLKMLNKTKAKQTPTPNTLTCSIFLKMKSSRYSRLEFQKKLSSLLIDEGNYFK